MLLKLAFKIRTLNTNKNYVFISIKTVVVNKKTTFFYTRRTALNLLEEFQQKEISDIRWLSLNKTRDYHTSKKELIYKIYFFILNLIKNAKPFNYLEIN